MLMELINFILAPKAKAHVHSEAPRQVHRNAYSSVPWPTIVIWRNGSQTLEEEVGQIFQARGIALANAFSIEEAGDGELEPFGGEGVAVMIRPKLVKSYFR